MKKLISLLAVIALVTVLATVAFAANDVALEIKDVEAAPGEEVVVNIEIVNNPGIAMGEFKFEFDTEALEFVSATAVGNGWDWLIMINDNTDNAKFGSVVFSASNSVLEGDCTLVTLTLKVKDDVKPGKYPVSAVVDFIGDDYEDLIVGTTVTGYVVIPCTDSTHLWGEWVVTKEAECGVPGEETRTCANCGETETREIAALEHAWGEWTVTKEAECGVPGEETRTCANCGETETRETAALEHAWGEWTVTKEAECGIPGEETRTCANCGETETREIAALEHAWGEWEVTTEATCKDPGVKTRTCANCGETETEEIPVNEAHVWDEGVKTDATCCEAGKIVYTCTICGATKEETIAATGEHELAYEAIDDVNHKVICKTSGKELTTEAHTFGEWIEDTENPGWKYQVCDKCQYKLLDDISDTGDNSMIAVAVAALSMLGIAVVVSKKKEF